jgi:alkylation response protein AidB-like acyl-CoA dehydrogenase
VKDPVPSANLPRAGSDVANITTTAERSACGKFYIVNGTKKWITNGFVADSATMAVRTGGEGSGAGGISLLVVPLKDQQGVSRRLLKVAGQNAAGTTFIELDDVRVPIENLVGKEGHGMRYIMNNFNHERLYISVGVTRQARVALSSAFAYTMKREAFGKVVLTRDPWSPEADGDRPSSNSPSCAIGWPSAPPSSRLSRPGSSRLSTSSPTCPNSRPTVSLAV